MASYFLPQQFSYSDNIRNWCLKTSVQPSQPTCCYVFTLYIYCPAVIFHGRIVLEKVIEDKVERIRTVADLLQEHLNIPSLTT